MNRATLATLLAPAETERWFKGFLSMKSKKTFVLLLHFSVSKRNNYDKLVLGETCLDA